MTDLNETNDEKKSTVMTEVTTLAQEDAKSGVKTPLPSAEEMVARASISMTTKRRHLNNIMSNLSKKATLRVLNAIFELPTADIPVLLKAEEEKMAFALGQRIQQDRFLIIQHAINKQFQELKEKQSQQQQEGV